MNNNDNQPCPPIQLLVPICPTFEGDGMTLAWLHGYALLTYRPDGAGMTFDAEIRINERYRENLALIRSLADALDPKAVVAGYDLTLIIGNLGRLPIESKQPRPALDLLDKLKTMLETFDPIDLSINDTTQSEVALQLMRHQLGVEAEGAINDELIEFGPFDEGQSLNVLSIGNDLIETAAAYMLSIGQLCLAAEILPLLTDAVNQWEHRAKRQLCPMAIALEQEGAPIIIN